jgi:protease-4
MTSIKRPASRILRVLALATLMIPLLSCGDDRSDEERGKSTEPRAVLFSVDGSLAQFPDPSGILGSFQTSQYKLEAMLKKATDDLRVQEIVVHVAPTDLSFARAGELALAIKDAGRSGKTVTCHVDAADNLTYWIVAQACPKILLSPAGGVEALGLAMEAVYLRELLASIGVKADILNVGKYKDAAEPLTRDSMSAEAREAAESLLFELHRLFIAGIAEGRKLDPVQVQALIDQGPYTAAEAVKLGLADGVSTLQALLDPLYTKYSGGVETSYGKKPAKSFSVFDIFKILTDDAEGKSKASKKPRIAVIPVLGMIMTGKGDSLFPGMNMTSDLALSRALSEAARDDTVKAVVLRVDSPGGSPLASDNIWLAVQALAARKPVVVSMGDVAASGGYYVASAATEVFASPTTITGSIGVVGGKMVIGAAAAKYGISTEMITTGKKAGLVSPFRPFNADEREAVSRSMRSIYDLFIDRVVEGRKLARDKVLEVAEGRVWTGSQALEVGLVDTLGSLGDAVERARVLADQPDGLKVDIYPEPKNLMEILSDAFSEPQTMVLENFSRRHRVLGHALGMALLLQEQQVLTLAPLFFEIR